MNCSEKGSDVNKKCYIGLNWLMETLVMKSIGNGMGKLYKYVEFYFFQNKNVEKDFVFSDIVDSKFFCGKILVSK